MKNKAILPVILFILLVISISAVSANDCNSVEADGLNSHDNSIQITTIKEDVNIDTSTVQESVESDDSSLSCSTVVEDTPSTSLDEGTIVNIKDDSTSESQSSIGSTSLKVSNPTIVKTSVSTPLMAAGSSKNKFAVYLFGRDMYNIDLSKLKSYHIGNIFLNYYSYELYGKSKVESFIKKANSYGIKVHIWMQVYYDGQWHNPATASSSYINSKIKEAVKYAKLAGVAGIHLDYLRFAGSGSQVASKYPNGVRAINSLVQKIVKKVKAVDKNIMVSAALLPEREDAIKYYGQNSAQLGNYLDVIIPMAYKGNYGASSSWIKSTAKYYAKNSGKAEVWLALQGYKSDSNPVKLSVSELKKDATNAIGGGSNGVVFFRYGLSNLFDVNTIPGGGNTTKVTLSEILNAAKTVRKYYTQYKMLPRTVKIGSFRYTMAEFLYYESYAISNLYSGKTSSINVIGSVSAPSSPDMGDKISNKILTKYRYADSAKRTYQWIYKNDQGPNYSTTNIGKINFNNLVEGFSAILCYYNVYKVLPDFITVTYKKRAVLPPKPVKKFTINQIITAARTVKNYYANNGELPYSVIIGPKIVTMPQLLYYESLAIVKINNKDFSGISVVNEAYSQPEDPFMGDNIKKKHLKLADYVDSAKRTYKWIYKNKQGPNYSTTAVGKVNFNALTDGFSRILSYYGNHKKLPATCTIDTYSDTSSVDALAKSLTKGLKGNFAKAKKMFNWVRDNIAYDFYYNSQQGAEKTLRVRSGNCCDQSNLYVAMCRSVGITIRYVHGYCHFSDGWFGHVWTEVKIGKKWYSADCISTKNTFGKINNWDTNTVTIWARYDYLPF